MAGSELRSREEQQGDERGQPQWISFDLFQLAPRMAVRAGEGFGVRISPCSFSGRLPESARKST